MIGWQANKKADQLTLEEYKLFGKSVPNFNDRSFKEVQQENEGVDFWLLFIFWRAWRQKSETFFKTKKEIWDEIEQILHI